MDQKQIMELLQEAAQPDCTCQRINQIQLELSRATVAMGTDGVRKIEGKEAGISVVLNTLFADTFKNRRDLLPTLFPAFAIICGDRYHPGFTTNVDWSIVEK
jgi:hypothetical protein